MMISVDFLTPMFVTFAGYRYSKPEVVSKVDVGP